MASLRSAQLRRRLEVLMKAAQQAVERRETLRERAKAAAVIGAALARAKIDPTRISALRLVDNADRELSRIGDTPQLQRADAAFAAKDPRLATRMSLAAEAAHRAPSFAGRPPPDLGASLLDWYAWSLAAQPTASARGRRSRGGN